jgi:RNA polymerase sigma-70 factor (ECF subfamily)
MDSEPDIGGSLHAGPARSQAELLASSCPDALLEPGAGCLSERLRQSHPELLLDVGGGRLADDAHERFELLRREEDGMMRLARRLLGDPSDAEDLLQDVMVRILRHPTGPRDDECFRSWCYGLLRNAAADFRRTAARRCRSGHVGLDMLELDGTRTFNDFEVGLEARRVVEDGEALSALDREILLRRYVLEQTSSEIATELGSSPPAVRMKLKRLLARLRRLLVVLALWPADAESHSGSSESWESRGGQRARLG